MDISCKKCSAKMPYSSKFCSQCGAILKDSVSIDLDSRSGNSDSVIDKPANALDNATLVVVAENQKFIFGFESYSLFVNDIKITGSLFMGEQKTFEIPGGISVVKIQMHVHVGGPIRTTQEKIYKDINFNPGLTYFLKINFNRSAGAPALEFMSPDQISLDQKTSVPDINGGFKKENEELNIAKSAYRQLISLNGSSGVAKKKKDLYIGVGLMTVFLLGFVALMPTISYKDEVEVDAGPALTKRVEISGDLCYKASGLSVGFAEFVAERMRVSYQSVSLIRSGPDILGSKSQCSVTVDTAKGPQNCTGADLYTNGKGDYWIGGMCF